MVIEMELMEFKKLLDQAFIGTSENHSNFNFGTTFLLKLDAYCEFLKENKIEEAQESFSKSFSRKRFGIILRDSLKDYADDNNCDLVLAFLDVIFKYCLKEISEDNIKDTNFRNAVILFSNNYFYLTGSLHRNLNDVRQKIYNNPDILKPMIDRISIIIDNYVNSLKTKEVFNFSSIKIEEVTETAKEILSSSNELALENTISGELLDGKISVATDRGYKTRPSRPQQDAVLSMVKSSDCYLNIVADGMGGAIDGEKASKAIIDTYKEWFDKLDEYQLKILTEEELVECIDDPLKKVNNELFNEYKGKSGSTIALTLTIGDKTIICNLGDSTVYSYNEETDELIELTKRDSVTGFLPYEEARNNMRNNDLALAVGFESIPSNQILAHYSVINNRGQKIIISSDGVTDLIVEERFKNYFKEDISASEIVDDAVNRPDVTRVKREDNTSAIVITLPGYEKRQEGSYYGRR